MGEAERDTADMGTEERVMATDSIMTLEVPSPQTPEELQ